jgi:hypothetical protein
MKLIRPCPAILFANQMMLTTRSKRVQKIFRDREQLHRQTQEMVRRQVAPHKPFHEVVPDGAWRGQPVFIIGGGPSLRGFDFGRLRGHGRIIAINRALEFIPWADIAFFMDWKLYKMYHESAVKKAEWDRFTGHRVFLNLMGRKLDDCFSIRSLGRNGCSGSHAKGLYHGNNSGHGAMNLAFTLGCSPIYLMGYDCGFHKGQSSHWHTGYGPRANPSVGRSFIREFENFKAHLKGRAVIYNLNPASALRAFPFKTIDEVLNDRSAGQGVGDDHGDRPTTGV